MKNMGKTYSTKEVIARVGIAKATLYNWLRAGKVPEVIRNRNNHRVFTEADVLHLQDYKNQIKGPMKSFLVGQEITRPQHKA
jgi:predicted site-specific integrase-resolvase